MEYLSLRKGLGKLRGKMAGGYENLYFLSAASGPLGGVNALGAVGSFLGGCGAGYGLAHLGKKNSTLQHLLLWIFGIGSATTFFDMALNPSSPAMAYVSLQSIINCITFGIGAAVGHSEYKSRKKAVKKDKSEASPDNPKES